MLRPGGLGKPVYTMRESGTPGQPEMLAQIWSEHVMPNAPARMAMALDCEEPGPVDTKLATKRGHWSGPVTVPTSSSSLVRAGSGCGGTNWKSAPE
eukprot:316810-Chlamydomonas_euryale.AAC.1